jgi:hypothetical protein
MKIVPNLFFVQAGYGSGFNVELTTADWSEAVAKVRVVLEERSKWAEGWFRKRPSKDRWVCLLVEAESGQTEAYWRQVEGDVWVGPSLEEVAARYAP